MHEKNGSHCVYFEGYLQTRQGDEYKDETSQTRMCVYLSATRIFLSRDRESSQYAQIRNGFNRYNFDRDTRTDYGREFYGSSSEARFRHCIWGKFSNQCQVLLLLYFSATLQWVKVLPTVISPK